MTPQILDVGGKLIRNDRKEKGRGNFTPLSINSSPYLNLVVAVYRQAIKDADENDLRAFDFLMRDPYGVLSDEMKGGLVKRYANKRRFF